MTQFAFAGFVTCAALLAGGVSAAAPVPKDKADDVPDLKEFFTALEKAVKTEKWPAEAEEKKLLDTTQAIFDRTLKAAEQKGRRLPTAAGQLKKLGPFSQGYKTNGLFDTFLIGSDIEINGAHGCVIFATGDVKINGASDCVIIGKNVRCNGVDNCFVVAGEYLTVTGANSRKDAPPSVLIGGQWVRAGSATGAVCHVLSPGTAKAPDDKLPIPIYITRADDVIFLNTAKQWQSTRDTNCKTIEPKAPIAK